MRVGRFGDLGGWDVGDHGGPRDHGIVVVVNVYKNNGLMVV